MKKITTYLLILLGVFTLVSCGSTKSIPTQSASTTYKVGDMYNQNGVKGIVVEIDASGIHGKIMSLESTKGKWLANKDLKYNTNAFHDEDGEKNMEAIESCIRENNASWSDFPVFEWARSLGSGWYIPARVEARSALINLKAAFKERNTYRTAKAINRQITMYGGDRMIYHNSHISNLNMIIGFMTWNDAVLKDLITSTERDGGADVWLSNNNPRSKIVGAIYSDQTRAFHKF